MTDSKTQKLSSFQNDPACPDPVIGLCGRQVGIRFQQAVLRARIDTEKVTSHSGRVGLSCELTSRRTSVQEVALAGGWKSSGMVIHYSRQVQAEQGTVQKYF